MLKRLKRTWKEEEAQKSESSAPTSEVARSPSPLLNDSQRPLDNETNVLSHQESDTALPIPAPKRGRDVFEPDTIDVAEIARPAKLQKTEPVDLDPIRNHLPEIFDSRERYENQLHVSIARRREQIYAQAIIENTIADIPATNASTSLLVDLIAWAIEIETKRPKSIATRGRTVVVVVEDVSSMDTYTSVFEKKLPLLSFGKYTEDIHKPEHETWAHFVKRDIVLIPSHLLLDSLLRGALAITHIHLLVITDAQNIRNQDSHSSMPIVQVMNDFYRITDSLSRPRIFVLMSSGDRRTHFDSKMLKLEQALDSKVFGVTEDKRAEILALPDRPSEVVILYDTSKSASETRLLKQLHQLDPDESVFRRYYRASRNAHEDIGSCASDLVWRRNLKAMESKLIPMHADADDDDPEIPAVEATKIKMYSIVKNWPFTMPNLDASSRGFNVSHKFLRLVQILTTFKPLGEGFRGIIFVQRRAIALVLADLLRTLDDRLGFLRPRTVVGYESDPNYYQGVFQRFATGVDNLLITTKSMEDFDIPKASVVIRYDLFESQVSHAYVRARTRGRESHLIHMVERGNDTHMRILSRITNLDADMLKWTEVLCNSPESSIPPRSLRESINPYHSDSDEEEGPEQPHEFIKDATTGGRIYLQDATTVIYRYASKATWIVPELQEHQRLFQFQDVHKEFGIPRSHRCSIYLPNTPIHAVTGDELPSKGEARRSACFKACQRLYTAGLLDYRLIPLSDHLRAQHVSERLKGPTNTLPELKSQGTRPYPRKQPGFWENSAPNKLSVLYPTVISVARTIAGAEAFGPIVMLTKAPLPTIPSFRLFFSSVAIHVHFQRAPPMHIDASRMQEIHKFTMRIHRGVLNKAIIGELEDMPYFFLPLPPNWQPTDGGTENEDLTDVIPWDTVSLAAQNWAVAIKRGSPEELEVDMKDAIIQDRWIEFTRRYKVVEVRKDLTPLSKPADSPREASYGSLYDFCKSKRKGLETLEDFGQPIIEVSKCHAIMNHLNPTSKPPATSKSPAKYLIPELCAKFTIPASTMWTAMLIPSIMRRVDELILVKEMNARFFDHAIREDLLHIAICAPSAGYEYDYERLELLGDAFLKYLASIYVFVTCPSLTEGALHVERQKVISNKALLVHSSRVGLPSYIQSKVFAYKTWLPPKCQVFIPPKLPKEGQEPSQVVLDQSNPSDQEEPVDVDEPDHERNAADVPELPPVTEGSPMIISSAPSLEQANESTIEPGEIIEEIIEEDTFSDAAPPDPDLSASRIATPIASLDISSNIPAEPASNTQVTSSKKKPKNRNKKSKLDEKGIQWLGDKAIADVAEAIIGAAYITGGRDAALQAAKAITLPLSNIDRWSDFGRKVLTPPPNVTAKLKAGSISAIEDIIGHKFNRPHLLGQAMTHSSIQGYDSTSYERLEFIGDSILDFMVIRHIFDRDQQLSPGALTMLKGAMVSNSALAAVCVWSGLHRYLLYESPYLENSIRAYASELEVRQREEYEQAKAEGRPPGQYWLDIDPPKALSDVVESIAGAVYISDNFDPVGAEALFDNVLKPFYDKHITLQTLSHHPTKILFELLQAQGCQNFEVVKDIHESLHRCHVIVHDVILVTAEDVTPSSAGRLASFLALDALEGDADFMTRTCDCRSHVQVKKSRIKSEFEKALEKALAGDDTEEE